MSPSSADRPQHPDPDLLGAAVQALEAEIGGALHLPVIDRWERPKSTVFHLRGEAPNDHVELYYKQDLPHTRFSVTRAESLRAEQVIAPAAATRLAAEQMLIDEPVLIEPERLVGIRRAVPGRALGKAITHAVPGRRRTALERYARLGRAIAMLEAVGASGPPPPRVSKPQGQILRDLERCTQLSSNQRSRLRSQTMELTDALAPDQATGWCHGDVSQTNVLVGSSLAVIDASWTVQLLGWDTARLVARLACEQPRSSRWSAAVIDAVLDGYGISAPARATRWQLALLARAADAGAQQRNPALRAWGDHQLQQPFGASRP